MDIVSTRTRAIHTQRFDGQIHGRVVWATNAGRFNNFLSSLIKASQVILAVNTSWKAVLYLVGVLAMSLLFNLFNFQDTITTNRHNPVTHYFVYQSWTLSLILLGVNSILTSTVYNVHNMDILCSHIFRLLLGAVFSWLCLVFNWINSVLGTCSLKQHSNPDTCLAAGGSWYGFNISLDVFLMIHCTLTISEEVKTYQIWNKLGQVIYRPYFRIYKYSRILHRWTLLQGLKITLRKEYNRFTPIITVIVVCLAALLLMFDFMLVVSLIYNYHMITGNIAAVILAIVGWYIIYQIWDPICGEDDQDRTIDIS